MKPVALKDIINQKMCAAEWPNGIKMQKDLPSQGQMKKNLVDSVVLTVV